MEGKRQNLFLFLEENDDEKDISSSLVRLYMNRFVISEEDQNEIIGVYNLAKPNKNTPLIEFYSKEPFAKTTDGATQFQIENKTKLDHDRSVFEKLGSEITSAVSKEKSLYRRVPHSSMSFGYWLNHIRV